MLLIGWGIGALASLDARNVNQIVIEEQQFVDAGGRVLVAETPTGVDRQRCDALNSSTGVVAATAVSRLTVFYEIRALPGSQVAVITATSGIAGFVANAAPVGTQAALTPQLTERIGIGPGESIELVEPNQRSGPVTTNDTVPAEPLTIGPAVDLALLGDTYNTGVLIPAAPIGVADACYVWAEPSHLEALSAALPALLVRDGEEATVRPRLFEGEFTVDYQRQYDSRTLRYGWIFGAVVLTLVWQLLTWTRRSRDALYASVGADASTRATIRLTEWIVVATTGGVWATAIGILLATHGEVPTDIAWEFVVRQVVATLAASTALITVTGLLWRRASVLAALKDK
ncbi:MAG: hypothetical protein WBV06_16255 [Acidimicrobiia bacterium]